MMLLSMDDLGHHAAVQDELHEGLDRSRLDKLEDLLTREVISNKCVPILKDELPPVSQYRTLYQVVNQVPYLFIIRVKLTKS